MIPSIIRNGFCLLLCFFSLTLNAQWTNGQNALFVIGQPDFSTQGANLAINGLDDPEGVAVDLINKKLYVADGDHNLIKRYSLPITQNQPDAELVFGQPDFNTGTGRTTQNGLDDPKGIFVDNTGRLWVAEDDNDRVVWYNNAYAITTNQPNADGVLGQPNFITNTANTNQNGMNNPCSVTGDANGTIWITDASNHRILRFDNAATKANGADADGVLGQPDFITNTANISQNGLDDPEDIHLAANGTLWIAEDDNNRVVGFNNAVTKADGANADRVLGQPNFTTNTANTTQNGMNGLSGVTTDCVGNLYVVDEGNERVLIFLNPISKSNGANADFVLGQSDFTTATENTTQNGLNLGITSGLAFYEDFLFIVDASNERVIVQQATDICQPVAVVAQAAVPTMSEWGLIIFGLLVLNLGGILIYRKAEILI